MNIKKISVTDWLLGIWILFGSLINFLWLKIDHRPSRWDESASLYLSEYSFQKLKHLDIIGALQTHNMCSTKPGFISFLTAISYFFVGHSTQIAIFLLNSVSLIIIQIAIYLTAKTIFNKASGLLACILFISYPGISLWSRYYTLDLPLTAAVAMTVLLGTLLIKDNFKNKKLSLLLGITFATGICIKHLYFGFASVPVFLLFLYSIFEKKGNYTENLKQKWHFYTALILGFITGAAYQALNYKIITEQLSRQMHPQTSAISWWIPPTTAEYFSSFKSFELGSELGNFFLILFSAGLIFSLFKFSRLRLWLYIWLFWSFYLLIFLIYSKSAYYFHPIVPLFALISTAWLDFKMPVRINNMVLQPIKAILIIIIALMPVSCYLNTSLGTSNILQIALKSPRIILSSIRIDSNPFVKRNYWSNAYVDGNVATKPYPQYWPVDEILDAIIPHLKEPKTYSIASLTDYEWMTGEYFMYKIWQKEINNKVNFTRELSLTDLNSARKTLSKYDFIVLKTDHILKNDFYAMDWAVKTQKCVDSLVKNNYKELELAGFRKLKTYPLPDGSTGSVWISASTH